MPMLNLSVIKAHEGCKLQAYQDVAGIWTIGYGNTFMLDGTPVKKGDTITQEQADELLDKVANLFLDKIKPFVKADLNPNQWAAILSFAYNVGPQAFIGSTLLKKINANPNDPAIRDEFGKWVLAGGKPWKGLLIRRRDEADLYFKPFFKTL